MRCSSYKDYGKDFFQRKRHTSIASQSTFVGVFERSIQRLRITTDFHLPRICVGSNLGFLPITKRSDELDKALVVFQDTSPDEWRAIFKEAVEAVKNGETDKTLVRILWNNY